MKKAIALTAKIEAKADELLAPLDLEMRMAKWDPKFQRIMWDAVHLAIVKRLAELP